MRLISRLQMHSTNNVCPFHRMQFVGHTKRFMRYPQYNPWDCPINGSRFMHAGVLLAQIQFTSAISSGQIVIFTSIDKQFKLQLRTAKNPVLRNVCHQEIHGMDFLVSQRYFNIFTLNSTASGQSLNKSFVVTNIYLLKIYINVNIIHFSACVGFAKEGSCYFLCKICYYILNL